MKRTLTITVEVDTKRDDIYAALERGLSRGFLAASQNVTKKKQTGQFYESGTDNNHPHVAGIIDVEWSLT